MIASGKRNELKKDIWEDNGFQTISNNADNDNKVVYMCIH
jgi:hypothetical protein